MQTLYFMNYTDQLVLTGEINDVGSGIMVNVDESYRAGIELQAAWKPTSQITWNVNATYSQNKIKDFTELRRQLGLLVRYGKWTIPIHNNRI